MRAGTAAAVPATAWPDSGPLDIDLHFYYYGNMENKAAVDALAALAQDTRLAIFRLLVQHGPSGVSAGEIGAALRIPPATLSFHLKAMAHAGLIASRQETRFIFYSANFDRMNALIGFLTENCCAADGVSCAPGTVCAPRSSPKPAAKAKRKGVKA
jgi:DNA-binding transcriptional ArsR family regulator